jgi:hypothetical protein
VSTARERNETLHFGLKAVIERGGRWVWRISIHEGGPMRDGIWVRFSRKAAERKARTELARYRRKQEYSKERYEIKAD